MSKSITKNILHILTVALILLLTNIFFACDNTPTVKVVMQDEGEMQDDVPDDVPEIVEDEPIESAPATPITPITPITEIEEIPAIEQESEQIITEVSFMINIIPEYEKYFLQPSKDNGVATVYGMSAEGLQKIEVVTNPDVDTKKKEDKTVIPIATLKDFFIKQSGSDNVIYLTVSTGEYDVKKDKDGNITESNEIIEYYTQKNGELKKVDTLPTRPARTRVVFDNSEFFVKNFDYNGKMYSDIRNEFLKSGMQRVVMCTGYLHCQGVGFYFNVTEGRGDVFTQGLYFWEIDRTSVNRLMDCGEVW